MNATAKPRERHKSFPESEVKHALEEWWKKELLERADDPFNPVPDRTGTLYELLPALDSLTIVRSFLIINKILEVKIPLSLIKPGGYSSGENFLTDLLPKIQKFYESTNIETPNLP